MKEDNPIALPAEPKPPKTDKEIQETERIKLAEMLFKNTSNMTAEYKALIQHTGGLLTSSMIYAYSKGIHDAVKLILKENQKNG